MKQYVIREEGANDFNNALRYAIQDGWFIISMVVNPETNNWFAIAQKL